ncbi:hypothetical protein NL676_034173 [Syzygium grande]|nr:hypothetical protein NL676_034173 [Syzygium grande]
MEKALRQPAERPLTGWLPGCRPPRPQPATATPLPLSFCPPPELPSPSTPLPPLPVLIYPAQLAVLLPSPARPPLLPLSHLLSTKLFPPLLSLAHGCRRRPRRRPATAGRHGQPATGHPAGRPHNTSHCPTGLGLA